MSDPLALYHIIVKDQYIFEELDVFIESVILLLSHIALTRYYQVQTNSYLEKVSYLLPVRHIPSNVNDPVSDYVLTGEQHRRQRKLFKPFFSTSNMRQLLTVVRPMADRLTSTLLAELSTHDSTYRPLIIAGNIH